MTAPVQINGGLVAFIILMRETEIGKIGLETKHLASEEKRHTDAISDHAEQRVHDADDQTGRIKVEMDGLQAMLDFASRPIQSSTTK